MFTRSYTSDLIFLECLTFVMPSYLLWSKIMIEKYRVWSGFDHERLSIRHHQRQGLFVRSFKMMMIIRERESNRKVKAAGKKLTRDSSSEKKKERRRQTTHHHQRQGSHHQEKVSSHVSLPFNPLLSLSVLLICMRNRHNWNLIIRSASRSQLRKTMS